MRIKNGFEAQFQYKLVDLSSSLCVNRPETHSVLLPTNFGFACLNKHLDFCVYKIKMVLSHKIAVNSQRIYF